MMMMVMMICVKSSVSVLSVCSETYGSKFVQSEILSIGIDSGLRSLSRMI